MRARLFADLHDRPPAASRPIAPRSAVELRVVDAVLDLAADGHLHRLGDRHGASSSTSRSSTTSTSSGRSGPRLFWRSKLNTVYSAWWFLLILAFLVVSRRRLCIARNTPKIIADLRALKENLREQACRRSTTGPRAPLALSAGRRARAHGQHCSAQRGWKCQAADVRAARHDGRGRKGMANKLGYLAAHASIVLICLGGLLDGDLIVRAQMALRRQDAYAGGGHDRDVPAAAPAVRSQPDLPRQPAGARGHAAPAPRS